MSEHEPVQFFAATDVGRKRAHNEDNFLVDRNLRLFIVADGMGGHAAGEVASAIAVRTMHQVIMDQRERLDACLNEPDRDQEILQILKRGVQTASRKIFAAAQRDTSKRGMGTTLSALLLGPSRGYIAHVGDSRIYLLRRMNMQQLTADHTVINELLRLGMISPDEVSQVPKKNSITRAVGVYEHVDVDTLTVDVLAGDQFVLASDGLTGYLDDQDASLFDFTGNPDGEKVVRSLINFALEAGGKDNITAILVRLAGEAEDARAAQIALARAALKTSPLFAKLTERERLHVMQITHVKQFGAGETVIAEGAFGDEMFVTVAGRLRVAIGDTELQELQPGDHFGEMALLRRQPRTATVVAIENSDVMVIPRLGFFDIIRDDSRLAVKLLWQFLTVLSQRLEQTSHDLHDALGEALEESMETSRDPFSDPSKEAIDAIQYATRTSERLESMAPLPETAQFSANAAPPNTSQETDEEISRPTTPAPPEGFDAKQTRPARRRMERKKTLSSPLPAEVKQLLREDDTLGVSQLDEPGDNVLSDGQKPGGGDGER